VLLLFDDARNVPKGSTLDADICIVGAGAAGITLARELAHTKARVVILESGGFDFDPKTQALDEGPNIGLPYFPLDTARLRYFGGTTNHWGGVCRPFDDTDFEAKEWVPRSGWPISRADVDAYYERARVICHVTTSDWSLAGWRKRDRFSPLDFGGTKVVTRPAQVVARSQRSFGRAYRDDVRRATNVTVYLHANVTELVADPAVTRVTTVRAATLDGNTFTVAAKAFVLATGALENARLLLLSNQQRPAGLGNDHDLVGRHFLEHPRFQAGMVVPTRDVSVRFYEQHRVGSARMQGYIALSREVQRTEGLVDVQVRLEPVYDRRFADALASRDLDEAKALAKAAKAGRVPKHIGGRMRDVVDDLTTFRRFVIRGAPLPVPYPEVAGEVRRRSPRGRRALIPEFLGDIGAVASRELTGKAPLEGIAVVTRIEPVPNPSSRIVLTGDRDALGLRKIALDWKLSPLDKHSARRTLEILGAEFGRAGLGRLRITMDASDDTWPEDLAGGWHHMGTTRMSTDPKLGVVDRDLRVHGLANLFVAGSSVFPTAGSGTPTMLIVALALRLADHLRTAVA
jgi:choline dehydrogenase-like flavoprotein